VARGLGSLPVTARLGLDLGARELKLVEANGDRLVQHAEILLPDGAIVDGMPTPLLTAALRSTVQEGSFSASEVRIAIAETGTAFRDFRLPALPASELNSAVLFEGRRLVPMEASDVYFAWHAVHERHGYSIYLVAARRDMIDGVVATVGAAGLRVEHIDLKPLALARGMGVWEGLLLEWGAAEATLALMVRGRPRFFRTFQLDASPDDVDAQLEELSLSVSALVKFMRGAASEVSIGPSTALMLGGRFAFLEDGAAQAQRRFDFKVTFPLAPIKAAADFPWQAHLAGIGLIQQKRWQNRLTPSQGGDIRVAA
jgi:Type IV pilus assembly protein PilM